MARGNVRKYENSVDSDALFEKFAELYIEYRGNGHRAALAAGYPKTYAKSYSYRLVARLKLKMGPVMRRFGLDEVRLATEIGKLLKAKAPKWNPETKKFVAFDDSGARAKAIDVMADLLDARPAKRLAGDPDNPVMIRLVSSIPKRGAQVPVQ